MRHSLRCYLLALCCVLYAAQAFAQAPGITASKIAVVDMKRLIDAAPQFAAGKQRVIAELASIERALKLEEQKLGELKRRRETQGATLPPTELKSLLATIETTERAIKRGREDLNQRIASRTNEVVRDLDRTLSEMIAQVAKSQGADVVMSSTAIVYGNPRIDITDLVLARLRGSK
jgi:Skp family chaperone for outer membrane proteins